MRTYIEKTRTLPEPETIVCNKCGKILNLMQKDFEPWLQDTMINISHEFGYGTSTDGDSISFDLCNDCLEEFVNTFQIPAERINNYG